VRCCFNCDCVHFSGFTRALLRWQCSFWATTCSQYFWNMLFAWVKFFIDCYFSLHSILSFQSCIVLNPTSSKHSLISGEVHLCMHSSLSDKVLEHSTCFSSFKLSVILFLRFTAWNWSIMTRIVNPDLPVNLNGSTSLLPLRNEVSRLP